MKRDREPCDEGVMLLGLIVPACGIAFVILIAIVSALLTNCQP